MKSAIHTLIIIFLVVLLYIPAANAQMRHNGKKAKKVYCPIESGKDFNYSLGIRVGDPYGITAKMYMPKRWGIEIVAGRTFPGLYNEAGEEIFENELTLPYDQSEYLGHEVRKLYTAALRGVYHIDIHGYDGLDWYLAGGAQVRYYQVHYVFEFINENPFFSDVSSVNDTYFAWGPELALGFEYVIPYRPMSSFAEIGFFMDLANANAKSRFFGGLGVRYNF